MVEYGQRPCFFPGYPSWSGPSCIFDMKILYLFQIQVFKSSASGSSVKNPRRVNTRIPVGKYGRYFFRGVMRSVKFIKNECMYNVHIRCNLGTAEENDNFLTQNFPLACFFIFFEKVGASFDQIFPNSQPTTGCKPLV